MSADGPFIVDGEVVMAPAPEGWIVDLDNPTRDEATIRAIWWTLGVGNVLALLFLGQNLYVKWYIQRQLQIETVLLVISWAMGLFVMGWLTDSIRIQTTGQHIWEVKLDNFRNFMVIYYVCSNVYTFQLGLVKCALALFYRRISPAKWWQWTINALIGLIIAFTMAIGFVGIFSCTPVSASWDLDVLDSKCLDRTAIYLTIASTHVLFDLIMILLPIPVIARLQMGLKQKIGLIIIFTIGGSTVVSSALRLAILVPLVNDPDQTFGMTKAILWIIIECTLLIMCASLPTLKRFTTHVAPKLLGDSAYLRDKSYESPHASGRPSQAIRTFGQGSDRRKVDRWGMTVDNELGEEKGQGMELKHIGCSEPVQVRVSTLASKNNNNNSSLKKQRDNGSESSLEMHGNQSTWDPLPHGGDEQAIIQTRTFAIARD